MYFGVHLDTLPPRYLWSARLSCPEVLRIYFLCSVSAYGHTDSSSDTIASIFQQIMVLQCTTVMAVQVLYIVNAIPLPIKALVFYFPAFAPFLYHGTEITVICLQIAQPAKFYQLFLAFLFCLYS